jgi:YfiH family protein
VGLATKSKPKASPEILPSPQLATLPWLVHGFSTRTGGVSRVYGGGALNLGFTKQDSRTAVERNREILLKNIGAVSGRKIWPLITLRQVHSDLIHYVDGHYLDDMSAQPPAQPLAGDGLITDTPGVALAVLAADCLPVIVVDKRRRAIGVFHAGWRGTVKRIVEKGVGAMRRHFGSDPNDLVAAIGPGIRGCCYEVGEEVRTRFKAQFEYGESVFHEEKHSDPVREKYPMLFLTARAPGHSELPVKLFLDLAEANRRQLLDAGVSAKNIDCDTLALCTACQPKKFFSFRADKGVTGRQMGVVGIRQS